MKAKYKGRGGNSKHYKNVLSRRNEKKANAKPIAKKSINGYVFSYKAQITDRLHTFADLHKIKLVDTISITVKNIKIHNL